MNDETAVALDRFTLAQRLLSTTHMAVWDVLEVAARDHGDRPAVALDDAELTFGELHDVALRCASRLEMLGVAGGTRVGLVIGTSIEWVILHYAIARLGAIAVPVNTAFEPPEIRHVLEVGEVEILVTVEAHRGINFTAHLLAIAPNLLEAKSQSVLPSLRSVVVLPVVDDVVDRNSKPAISVFGDGSEEALPARGVATSSDPAYILFTSGSTAFPKAVVCRQRAITGAATGFAHALSLGPDDRLLGVLPTFHSGGITCSITAPHIAGACLQLLRHFDAGDALAAIEGRRCTATIAFDTMFVRMMAHPDFKTRDHSSLSKAALGATPSFVNALYDDWGFERIVTTYGSTESGALAAATPPSESDQHIRHSTNGRPLPGIDMIIVDPDTEQQVASGVAGEIRFRGWGRFAEYLGEPSLTLSAIDGHGFFRTGDYGSMDDEGRLTFLGRYKMMIKTGGENVAEREVEMLLEDDPTVELAQVVGVPDHEWGEVVVAFVQVSAPGASIELRERCRGRMARFKIPRHVFEVPDGDWPMLQNGKPDKSELRRRAATEIGAPPPPQSASAD